MSATIIPDWPVSYRLRRALDVAEVEPEQLAELAGVHPNTVWNYLAGRTRPKRAILLAAHHLTGVPLWWLEGDTPPEGGSDTEPHILREPTAHTIATRPLLKAA